MKPWLQFNRTDNQWKTQTNHMYEHNIYTKPITSIKILKTWLRYNNSDYQLNPNHKLINSSDVNDAN